ATSRADAWIEYTRLDSLPARSERTCTAPPETTTSPSAHAPPLHETEIDSDPGATCDSASLATTFATCTRSWFGGHSVHPRAGNPAIDGGVRSTLATTDDDAGTPALLVARQVNVVPPVSAATVVAPQPLEEAIP